jgi:hypothetical protein
MTLPLKDVHMGPQLKMNQTGWRATSPLLHPLIMGGPAGFHHLVALSTHPGRRPGPQYARGLLYTAKYHQTLVLGSIGPKLLQRWDVALGAHTAPSTGHSSGNLSHHRLMSHHLGSTPNSIMTLLRGKLRLVRFHLPCDIS